MPRKSEARCDRTRVNDRECDGTTSSNQVQSKDWNVKVVSGCEIGDVSESER